MWGIKTESQVPYQHYYQNLSNNAILALLGGNRQSRLRESGCTRRAKYGTLSEFKECTQCHRLMIDNSVECLREDFFFFFLFEDNLPCGIWNHCPQHTDMANSLGMAGEIDDVESCKLRLCACFKDELDKEMRYAGAWLFCSDGCLSI